MKHSCLLSDRKPIQALFFYMDFNFCVFCKILTKQRRPKFKELYKSSCSTSQISWKQNPKTMSEFLFVAVFNKAH